MAIRTERLCPPFPVALLARITGVTMAIPVSAALQSLSSKGCNADALATCIEMVSEVSTVRPSLEDSVQLVMTGPVESGNYHRDTKVVVADLFRRAESNVLIAGYAIHQGKKIFEELAARMGDMPDLHVRMFLNLTARSENSSSSETVSRFIEEFKGRHWPRTNRFPEIYYDRRTLEAPIGRPVSLHAKCVILDERELFISSANFTEAAHNRNIELGVLLTSKLLAGQVASFFNELVREGICIRAF